MPLKPTEIAARIRKEHQHLEEEMKKIRNFISHDVLVSEYPKWRLDFLWILRDFHNVLHKHFDLEEEGGFMSDVLEVAPHRVPAIEQLQKEHDILNQNLLDIIKCLKECQEKEDALLADVKKRILQLLDLLEEHEVSEGELLASTYLQDEGFSD